MPKLGCAHWFAAHWKRNATPVITSGRSTANTARVIQGGHRRARFGNGSRCQWKPRRENSDAPPLLSFLTFPVSYLTPPSPSILLFLSTSPLPFFPHPVILSISFPLIHPSLPPFRSTFPSVPALPPFFPSLSFRHLLPSPFFLFFPCFRSPFLSISSIPSTSPPLPFLSVISFSFLSY